MFLLELIRKQSGNIKDDTLSGLTVALALVPEAVAFAFVAGIDPIIGLYGAFIMGLITSIFGGRPGMISGATGAMAVVMVSMIFAGNEYGAALDAPDKMMGVKWLFVTLLLVGGIQIAAGLFKLGKFVRLIPHPVMMGFVNGLAIVIFLAQMGMFKEFVLDSEGNRMLIEGTKNSYEMAWLEGAKMYWMLGLVLLTMGIMYFLPKLTKKVPAALTAILVVSCIVIFGNVTDAQTIGGFIKAGGGNGLEASFPSFQTDIFRWLGNISSEAWFSHIIPTAVLLAAVGLIESLLTLNLVDDLTETKGNSNKECIAQGSANILNGLFGGMGGCAMIGQSIINVNSGGRGRLSGIVASVALLLIVLVGAPVIEKVPIAALVGVMFMVVIGTFAWSSFRILHKIPLSDSFVLILVSLVTVFADLAIAVVCGVIVSALVFAWENAKRIRARKRVKENGTKVYEIWGPLFFGSIQAFNDKFDVKNDPETVEIDFIESKVNDHSGIEAINGIVEKYEKAGKTIILSHLSNDCKSLLTKLNPKLSSVITSDVDDPRYYVVSDVAQDI